jgi:hypothetical protein
MDVDILLALWVQTRHELGTLMLTRNPAALLRHEGLRAIVKVVELSRSMRCRLCPIRWQLKGLDASGP